MDLKSLEHRIHLEIKRLYFELYPEPRQKQDLPGHEDRIRRLRGFRDIIKKHRAVYRQWDVKNRQIATARDALGLMDRGGKVLCFDTERSNNYGFEIGWTTYSKAEGHRSVNMRPTGSNRTYPFRFGEIEYASLDDIIGRLRTEAADGVDAYIGHSLNLDFDALKEMGYTLPRLPIFDTAYMSGLISERAHEILTLQDTCLAVLGGQESDYFVHVAGNDARYNIDVFLGLIERLSSMRDYPNVSFV